MSNTERARLEAKCDDLVACRLWPNESQLRYRAWLSNFDGDHEKSAAAKLLDRFVFIDQDYSALAIKSAYTCYLAHETSGPVGSPTTYGPLLGHHRRMHMTIIQGEEPNPTDSSYAYARIARNRLDIEESRIVGLEEAIALARQQQPIVLIDDFAGTGQQIYKTLARQVNGSSLLDVSGPSCNVCCITAAMTNSARQLLHQKAPNVSVFSGHFIKSTESSIWALLPPDTNPDVYALLNKYAPSLAVPSYTDAEFGFNRLGLLLGINDNIPDASLPIFWAPGPNGWTPLMEKKV